MLLHGEKKKNYVQTEGRGILAGGKHEKMLTQKQWQKKTQTTKQPAAKLPKLRAAAAQHPRAKRGSNAERALSAVQHN